MRATRAGEAPSWERQSWDDVEVVARWLTVDERLVLDLVRMGKTPSEMALLLCLPTRQHAEKEAQRVREVIRFYLDRMLAMDKVERLSLSTERQLLLEMFVLRRCSYLDVAKALKVSREEAIVRLRKLLDHLRRRGYASIAELLADTWSNRRLRVSMRGAVGDRAEWEGKRRVMMIDPWRYDLRNLLWGMVGKVDYEWGSQKFSWPSGIGVADCSGLVIECLKKVGKLPSNFRDITAQGLFAYCKLVKAPKLCDLVFYGKSLQSITHVMFYLGQGQLPEGKVSDDLRQRECVIGMCDGTKDMQACDARWLGAGLHVRNSPRYRRDFLAYGAVP